VAHDLIGCYLVRKLGQKLIKRRIMETEAYIGPWHVTPLVDEPRTEPMFGPAGTIAEILKAG
jgi:3-methyladenine DNA glycosylase Mpg